MPPGKEGFPYRQQERKWVARENYANFELPAGGRTNLLVVVTSDDPCGGSSTGLEISYDMNGVTYDKDAPTGIDMSNEATPACAR